MELARADPMLGEAGIALVAEAETGRFTVYVVCCPPQLSAARL